MNCVKIYVTGIYRPSIHIGAWAFTMETDITNDEKNTVEIVGSDTETTSNIMQLQGLIEALKGLSFQDNLSYHIHVDSNYIMTALKNRDKYEQYNFRRVKNDEKLQELYRVLDFKHLQLQSANVNKFVIDRLIFNNNLVIIKVEKNSENLGVIQVNRLAVRTLNKRFLD